MAVTETQVIKHLFYTSINCKWCTSGPNRSFDHVSLYFWKKKSLAAVFLLAIRVSD